MAISQSLTNFALDGTAPGQSVSVSDNAGTTVEFGPTFTLPSDAGGGEGVGLLPVSLLSQLQPASWRGLPFVILGTSIRFGRRKAIHEYPYRDDLWVEDLGRLGRTFGFTAFIVGDDVKQQMQAMVAACEQAGPGELVHPTFGALQCECLPSEGAEQWDAGRVWTLRLEFLEPKKSSLQLLPAIQADTAADVSVAADGADQASSDDFLSQVTGGLKQGYQAVQSATAAVRPFVSAAIGLSGDATRLLGTVRNLTGSFGRFATGGSNITSSIQAGIRTAGQAQSAVQSAIAFGARARSAVQSAGQSLVALLG